MRAREVVTSGRVRFVGVSNFTGAMMASACAPAHDVSQVGYLRSTAARSARSAPALVSTTASA